MNITIRHIALIGTAAILLMVCGLWLGTDATSSPSAPMTAKPKPPAHTVSSSVAKPATIPSPGATPSAQSLTLSAPPAFMFGELSRRGELVRKTSHTFVAKTWEPDLHKALDLPSSVPLQRRSGLFRMAGGFVAPLIRVDRIYRTDRPAAAASSVRSDRSDGSVHATAATLDPLDAEGGEILWENAMVADQLMVQAKANVTEAQLRRALPQACQIRQTLSKNGLYLVTVPAEGERSIELAIGALGKLPEVEFAEPDHLIAGADTTPNDTLFGTSTSTQQWHLGKIMAPRAWDVITGPKTPADAAITVVAVVDTGIDYTHPDLAPNIWTNPAEIPGNGEDDDHNGKVDDWHGWDFIGQSTTQSAIVPDNNPMDDSGHGTHVAGLVGAAGNNALGVSGVCWQVKLLPLRIIKKWGAGTYGTYSAAVAALNYIKELNSPTRQIAVANHSWGGAGYSLSMLNAINNPLSTADPLPVGLKSSFPTSTNQITTTGTAPEIAKIKVGMTVAGTGIPTLTLVTIVSGSSLTLSNYTTAARSNQALAFSNPVRPKPYGVVHVAAAGNSRFNSDRIPTYPASIPSGFVVSVGATDSSDAVSLWNGTAGSNYGRFTVDIFAPGTGIWSTKLKLASDSAFGYESRNGTSMAAPQVAGALALLRLWQPTLTDLQARQILIDQAEPVTALKEKCASGGRLNVARMVDKLYQPILVGSGGGTGGIGTTAQALNSPLSVSGRMAAGEGFFVFTDQGKVFVWGDVRDAITFGGIWDFRAVPTEVPGIDHVVMVSAQDLAITALKDDGTVWQWSVADANPAQVGGISDCVWVSRGYNHILALKADGTVWAWGNNTYGQLGDGTTDDEPSPLQVPGLLGIVQVAAGWAASYALADDGTVWNWGLQSSYYDPGAFTTTPALIPALGDVAWIGVDYSSGMAVKQDGTVWLWDTWAPPAPAIIAGLSNIVGGSLGGSGGLVIDANGDVFAVSSYASPVKVLRPDDAVFVACQDSPGASMAMTSDGKLYTWGDNSLGQLGIGKAGSKAYPVLVSNLAGVTSIAPIPNGFLGRTGDGTYAVTASGELYAWGSQVGSQRPKLQTGISGVAQIIAGETAAFAIKQDGSLCSWGSGEDGELGLGSSRYVSLSAPEQVQGLASVVSVAVRQHAYALDFIGEDTTVHDPYGQFALAVTSDGKVHAWGSNLVGQLGDGTTTSRETPAEVSGVSGAVKVVAGAAHVLVLKSNGTVMSWGRNQLGQLGIGSTTNRTTPQTVTGLTNVVDISAAGFWSFAVKADGTVWQWGNNTEFAFLFRGQIFPGMSSSAATVKSPQQVQGLPPIAKIRVSSAFQVQAVAKDGTLWTWGFNWLNARDQDSTQPADKPALVVGLSGVQDAGAHISSAFALKQDGTVWSWGFGQYGNLGDGEGWSSVPVAVLDFGGASSTVSSLGAGDTADSWFFQNFSVNELVNDNIVSDQADADRDGISNLLEYALGLDPRTRNSSGLPTARVDILVPDAKSESDGGQVQLFSTPTVDLTSGKRYMAYTVNRQGGIRQDIDYIVEVSDDLITWRSGDPHTITVLDTAETLEAYSALSVDDAPRQYMRLRIRRK